MSEHTHDVIIIGGGASGMMCAGILARKGVRVLLIEKNRELGRKLAITGGGRCNITNADFDIRSFLSHYKDASKYLYSPFSKFSAEDTIRYFEERGLPIVIEARKRAFPASQRATDVVATLKKDLREKNVTILTQTPVRSLIIEGGAVKGVLLADSSAHRAQYVVLATGGTAAPDTGATGDGFKMLEAIGHTISKPSPNIVPLKTNAPWVHKLSGSTCSFMELKFSQNGKVMLKKKGKILFTHFGISGPLVLNLSHDVAELLKHGPVHASVNLFPDTNEGDLDARVVKLFDQNKNKKLRNVLPELLLKSIAHAVIHLAGDELAEKSVHSITKDERKRLVRTMQGMGFEIVGTMGLDRAVIADGGLALDEVDFTVMTSRKFQNLYVLGDMLHINRPSGGFSLQLCWTTAWVAAHDLLEKLGK